MAYIEDDITDEQVKEFDKWLEKLAVLKKCSRCEHVDKVHKSCSKGIGISSENKNCEWFKEK